MSDERHEWVNDNGDHFFVDQGGNVFQVGGADDDDGGWQVGPEIGTEILRLVTELAAAEARGAAAEREQVVELAVKIANDPKSFFASHLDDSQAACVSAGLQLFLRRLEGA